MSTDAENNSSGIKLDTVYVGSMQGRFFIPAYQRGYRWGKEEVTRLLDDVYSNVEKGYCLQPIVVKNLGDQFELIDGQQRLTTLYLIYRYMHEASNNFFDAPKFSLEYKTRDKSQDFLQNLDLSRREENIDFWFICNAYDAIDEWFTKKEKKSALSNINKYFDERIQVIWYEVGRDQDSNELFKRLNIGKIPLTSSELVKAMFLSKTAAEAAAGQQGVDHEKQEEISLQWDNIERELHHDPFWYFLTNSASRGYQTRIDLVLDMMTDKPAGCKEPYYTYFAFDEMRQSRLLDEIWRDILNAFLILKDWFEDHDLYHKIGYLVAIGTSLEEIYQCSKGVTKHEFAESLDARIKASVSISKNYGELSYERQSDCDRISRLLLLFNVESVRLAGNGTQWFPFDQFKFEKGRKVTWSLEHIHAQQSEGMRTQEAWKEWLKLHLQSVREIGDDPALVAEMEAAINSSTLDSGKFGPIQQKVVAKLSAAGSTDYMHSIANLALLNTADNAALNNSTFDVKRNAIIDLDKKGAFIPHCTRLVFLKYYTPSAENQLHFWGESDRRAYVEEMNKVLAAYLPTEIILDKEVQGDGN